MLPQNMAPDEWAACCATLHVLRRKSAAAAVAAAEAIAHDMTSRLVPRTATKLPGCMGFTNAHLAHDGRAAGGHLKDLLLLALPGDHMELLNLRLAEQAACEARSGGSSSARQQRGSGVWVKCGPAGRDTGSTAASDRRPYPF